MTKLGYFDAKKIKQEVQITKYRSSIFIKKLRFSLLVKNKNDEVHIKIEE